MNRDQVVAFLNQKTVVDHTPSIITGNDLRHEVFNHKSPHFLDFKYFMDSDDDTSAPRGLITMTKATHGFRLTSKSAIYLPNNLRDAIPSITSPYPIPIKPSHRDPQGNRDIPAIGRAIGGRYVDDFSGTSRGFNFNISDATGRGHKDPASLEAIQRALKSGLLTDKNFEGLGFTLVEGLITDPEAIEKILDGRLLTVSVEMSNDDYINPRTGNSWQEDINEVDYVPGEIVDGVPAVMVAGNLGYEGYAYTTHPADSHARTTSIRRASGDQVNEMLENFRTTTVTFDSSIASTIRGIFDNVLSTTTMDTESSKAEENPGGLNMKELLDAYVSALNKAEDFDKARELYSKIVDSQEEVDAAFSSAKSLMLGGLPINCKAIVDAVSPVIKEVTEEKVGIRFEVLSSLVAEDSTPDPESCGNTSNETNSISDNVADGEDMTAEQLVKLLSEKPDLLKAVIDSEDIAVVASSEVVGLQEEVATLKTQVTDAAQAKDTLQDIYRDELKRTVTETVELKSALDSSVRDHRSTLSKFQFLAKSVSDKDFTDEAPVVLDSTITELMSVTDTLVDGLDRTELRTKIFGLAKEIEDGKVEDPTKTPDPEAKNQIEDKGAPTFSQAEIAVAERYQEKFQRGRKAEAKNYIRRMIKSGTVNDSFNPQAVIDSLGGEDKKSKED